MAKRRLVIENIWQIATDVNEAIWDKWHDNTVQEVSLLNRAPTYNFVWFVWRDGLEQSDLPPFIK